MKNPGAAIQKLVLSLASALLTLFAVFTLFEIFPDLPARLHLTTVIPYYALKERYVPDPSLIFKIRPFYSYRGVFPGDIHGFFLKSSFKAPPYEAIYDADGFRNEHGHNKTDVTVIGDSYMEVGLSNQDTFAAWLEKSSGLLTANYGMGWYGPFQYVEVLKRYAIENKPRFALFCFFEGNDLDDIFYYMKWQQGGAYYRFNPSGNILERFAACLKESAWAMIKFLIRRWDPRRAEIRLGNTAYHTAFVYSANTRSRQELEKSAEVVKLKQLLKEFNEICAQDGIQPVVLFIPSKSHIYLPYASLPAMDPSKIDAQKKGRAEVENSVHSAAQEIGMPWLSFTPLFEKMAMEGKFVYYETDTHWNTEGRRAAAEATAAFLKELSAAPASA